MAWLLPGAAVSPPVCRALMSADCAETGGAASAVTGYAGELGIHTLLADIEPENGPSQRLFRRLGFVWQQDTCYRLPLGEGITPDRG